ncbi:hypothetical protein [Burkholderia sp. HI2500]|uniref:hypothetical protein n=1 Tax=Burkholderia sp. HI2500 TaxID=2015358 RepID=UPI000B79BBA2|nr:hypothetical protein [Burkholderia sp. HI2500]OXJ17247.1 hypothetical protein CFB45_12320 [Burkholderia sp. HI2500]
MAEQSFSIYRIDRCFKTYGIRPFVLIASIKYGSPADATFRAGYLILHANGEVHQKLDVMERSILNKVPAESRVEFSERAALDDALDLLSADIETGGEAISSKFASPATLLDLFAARMREAIAAPTMSEDDYLPSLGDVIEKLKGAKAFKRV